VKALFLNKYFIDPEALIERSMPCEGNVFIKKGAVVQSFDRIGDCKVMLEEKSFTYDGDLVKKRGNYISQGEVVASSKRAFGLEVSTKSPFTGYIIKTDAVNKEIFIRKPSRPFELISGVPGYVTAIIEGRGVLITTRALRVRGVASYGAEVGAELLVFGEHNDNLKQENFENELAEKIVVCGHLTREAYAKGRAVGVEGFVCGSCNLALFNNLKGDCPPVLVLEGFGKIPLSPLVFDYLKSVQSRFVVLRACERELIIPESGKQGWCSTKSVPFVDVKRGQAVQIFSFPYYGFFGTVISCDEEKGLVKVEMWEKKEKIELPVENLGVVGG